MSNPEIFSVFFPLYSIIKVSLGFMYCLSQLQKEEKESKARVSITHERRVTAYCLDISQAAVVAAQIFDVLFFYFVW
jgi:hypothetical protein